MQITVEIPDHLAREAQARGLALDRRLAELLADDLAKTSEERAAPELASTRPPLPRHSGTRNMTAFFEAMAANSEKIPALPDEAFTRESFYRDHD